MWNHVSRVTVTLLDQGYPETVAELRKNPYVDDVISGGTWEKEVINNSKEERTLQKWHCSLRNIEEEENNDLKQTFANETLGTKTGEAKILALK